MQALQVEIVSQKALSSRVFYSLASTIIVGVVDDHLLIRVSVCDIPIVLIIITPPFHRFY